MLFKGCKNWDRIKKETNKVIFRKLTPFLEHHEQKKMLRKEKKIRLEIIRSQKNMFKLNLGRIKD